MYVLICDALSNFKNDSIAFCVLNLVSFKKGKIIKIQIYIHLFYMRRKGIKVRWLHKRQTRKVKEINIGGHTDFFLLIISRAESKHKKRGNKY